MKYTIIHHYLPFYFYFFIFILQFLLSLSWNLGCLTWVRLQQPQEQRYLVLQVHAGSLNYHNPPNSDIDYRIFNVCTWSFLCVRVHTGVAHTVRTFLTQQNSHKFFLCSWRRRDSNLQALHLESLPTEPPHHRFYSLPFYF